MLKQLGFPHTGQAKCTWAENIAPHLDVEANQSLSFQVFRQSFEKLDERFLSNTVSVLCPVYLGRISIWHPSGNQGIGVSACDGDLG